MSQLDTGIRKRGDAYQFRVSCGYRPDGTQIVKTRTYRPPIGTPPKRSEKLAKQAYAEFERLCTGAVELQEHMRFSELSDWYFEHYAPNKLKESTIYTYHKQVDLHFLPAFGNKQLCDFSPAFLSQFLQTHRDTRNKKISYGTSKKLYTILQSMFSCAVRQGFVSESPCKNIILPKRPVETTRKYMTAQELSEFMRMTEEYSQVNAILRLLLHTGMRSGECLALQWEDVDFDAGFIYIRHTLVRVKGKHFLDTPKTTSSVRHIAISDDVRALLLEHRKHHLERVRILGKNFAHPEMVFTSNLGGYRDRSALNTSLRRKFAGTDLDFLTLHMLRHCNASLLINSGVDLKIISDHLGHSDVGTTADIYADVFNETRKATAALVDSALKNEQNKGQIKDKNNIVPFKLVK